MTVKLELKPEVEAGLLAQAEAAGLSLDQFLSHQLATIVSAGVARGEQSKTREERINGGPVGTGA